MYSGEGHLVSIDQLSRESVLSFFSQIEKNKSKGLEYARPVLQNETVVLLFMEPSTRTRISFEIAAQKLGGQTIHVQKEGSSLQKGETILDTFETLHAMGCKNFVFRSPRSEIQEVAEHFGKKIILINAGDGINEHPTQALIDGFTIWEKHQQLEKLKVAIIGDIDRSRVAHSNIRMLNLFGNKPYVSGPPELMRNLDAKQVHIAKNIDEAIADADVVMMLRVQNERKDIAFSHDDKYLQTYGLTQNRLKLAGQKAMVMHPGPFNRGVEIESTVADGEQSVILQQVNNGVWVRMALLEMLHKAAQ